MTRMTSFCLKRPRIHWCWAAAGLLLLSYFGFANQALANNIQIANGRVVQDGAQRLIEFDLSWENSWRVADLGDGVGNWDAAWVFIKYREPEGAWQHAWLSTRNDDHNPGAGTAATIDIGATEVNDVSRGMGAFIYRSENGSGTFSTTGTRLQWNFADQGLEVAAPLEVRVFAIEMVYVAEGAFVVGSGGTEPGSFTDGSWSGGASIPFSIASEDALSIESSSGSLWDISSGGFFDTSRMGPPGTLPAAFPKGFAPFYSMKYSISQQQYVDFLNTLSYDQQNARIAGSPSDAAGTYAHGTNRHAIKIKTPGVENTTPAEYETDHPFVANAFMNWMDGLAYMDWAGLRPMTELEYEKAARGLADPVPDEYAWGTADLFGTLSEADGYIMSDAGGANETLTPHPEPPTATQGNVVWSGTARTASHPFDGPIREGAFATSSSNRVSAGASYWGIMALNGNLWEKAVTVGDLVGREFTGRHGDGMLSVNGHANVAAWPGLVDGEVTTATGFGDRGGPWTTNAFGLRLSRRSNAISSRSSRLNIDGFRGVRSAPATQVEE